MRILPIVTATLLMSSTEVLLARGKDDPSPCGKLPAETMVRAHAAYDAKRYADAMRDYLSLAQCGSVEAQHRLGGMYLTALGVPLSLDQARTWYQKAAEQGEPESQYNLGLMYEKGLGGQRDPAAARMWQSKAAAQGFARSQNALGAMLYNGTGGPRNDKEALYWFTRAAEQGHTEAQLNVATFYDKGIGVPKDLAAAIKWRFRAAARGEATAQLDMAVTHFDLYTVLKTDHDLVKSKAWAILAERNTCTASSGGSASPAPSAPSQSKTCDMATGLQKNYLALKLTPATIALSEQMASNWLAGKGSIDPPSDDTLRDREAALLRAPHPLLPPGGTLSHIPRNPPPPAPAPGSPSALGLRK